MNFITKGYKTIVVLLIVAIFASCEKEVIYDIDTGQLAGNLRLFGYTPHQFGLQTPLSDHSGVKVTAEGSKPEISTYSDIDGNYVLENLPSGTYNFLFEKEGFYPIVFQGVTFVAGEVPQFFMNNIANVYMSQKINTEILSLNFEIIYTDILAIRGTFSNPDEVRVDYMCYLSDSPDVSYNNYMECFRIQPYGEENRINHTFRADEVLFPSGSTLYAVLYPYVPPRSPNISDLEYYYDYESGEKIYLGIDNQYPSQVIDVVVPESIY